MPVVSSSAVRKPTQVRMRLTCGQKWAAPLQSQGSYKTRGWLGLAWTPGDGIDECCGTNAYVRNVVAHILCGTPAWGLPPMAPRRQYAGSMQISMIQAIQPWQGDHDFPLGRANAACMRNARVLHVGIGVSKCLGHCSCQYIIKCLIL